MLRSAFAHWYPALALALVLILVVFPGDETTEFFLRFGVTMLLVPPLCAALVLAWRRYHKRTPAPRVITHADGTRARVDGAGKGYERLPSQSAAPSLGGMRRALRELGKRL